MSRPGGNALFFVDVLSRRERYGIIKRSDRDRAGSPNHHGAIELGRTGGFLRFPLSLIPGLGTGAINIFFHRSCGSDGRTFARSLARS